MYMHLHKYTEIITKLHTVELRAVSAQPGKVSLFAAYTKKKKEMCYTYGFLIALLPLVALVCLSSPPSAAAAAAAATATTPTTIPSAAAYKHQLLMHHSHHNHHHNHHEHQGKEELEDEEEKSSNKNTKVSEDVVVSY